MGTILKLIQDAVRDTARPALGTSLKRAHTGRVSSSLSREEQACELLVNRWLDGPSDDQTDWGRLLVKELINERARCTAPATYRARSFPHSVRPSDLMEFGPPPCPGAGRYNRSGQAALYLGTDRHGVIAEMARFTRPGTHCFYARYSPIEALKMVDLSDPSAHPALHHAFDRAERLDVQYEPAQRIADVIRELRIDGIIVPGVRGSTDHHYTNIVVFNCHDWAAWLDTRFLPERLLL